MGNELFDKVLQEAQSPITVDDGIKYLSIWNNNLSSLINNIIGYSTKEKLSEANQITLDVSLKVAELSERILGLSKSIDKIIITNDNNRELDQTKHNSFIVEINSGIETVKTVQSMISSPKYADLKDILIGLEKNFRKFYNTYLTVLNINDPNEKLQRPEEYDIENLNQLFEEVLKESGDCETF
jgi:hypothetical protein